MMMMNFFTSSSEKKWIEDGLQRERDRQVEGKLLLDGGAEKKKEKDEHSHEHKNDV